MGQAPHLEAFLDAARYFVGLKEIGKTNKFSKNDPRGAELLALAGCPGYEGPWCAATVSACVTKAGAQEIIARSTSTSAIMKGTVAMGGTAIAGPYINGGEPVIPQAGDIITFADSTYHGLSHGCHIGIVEYVDDSKVHTIEGNSSDQCKRNEFAFNTKRINAYIRPDWARLGDVVGGDDTHTEAVTYAPLYDSRNDRHDMTLRQACYLDGNYNLTNNGSGIAISIINYTSVLGDLYDMFAPAMADNVTIDTSQLEGNDKIAVDYFLGLEYSASTACALTGCLYAYSRLDPMANRKISTSYGNGYGIGMWDSDKLAVLKSRTDASWNINLSAQLEYFTYDLYTNYSGLFSSIKHQPLNESAVAHVVESVIKTYNPVLVKTVTSLANDARDHASELYSKLVITQDTVVGGSDNTSLRDINGGDLPCQYSVPIPGDVLQTGIIDDYTSYSHWYSKWNKSSPQRKLAVLWGEQGFPCDKGIATIGGYYCCAVRPKFGRCGEVIVVTLEDGTTFNGIICDEKGEDAGSEWGHKKSGGKISLIEWERVKTIDGKVITSGTTSAGVDTKGFNDWYGKKVLSIANYGKYVSVGWG